MVLIKFTKGSALWPLRLLSDLCGKTQSNTPYREDADVRADYVAFFCHIINHKGHKAFHRVPFINRLMPVLKNDTLKLISSPSL